MREQRTVFAGLAWIILAAKLLAGCATSPGPEPSHGTTTAAAYYPSDAAAARSGPAPAWDGSATESWRIPGGATCLGWLSRLGIQHRLGKPQPGLQTPVELRGPVGGVRYTSAGRELTVSDCRLVLALDWIGPTLRGLGVQEIRHSGAYAFRRTRAGRLSLHARGLALDVHQVVFGQQILSVKDHFARGSGCGAALPRLNQLACQLRKLRLFRELITPDHNADHHDHLHLAIAPLN